MANDNINNINSILSNLKDKLSCDSTCQKQRTTTELKQNWLNAKEKALHSDEEIETAKKNYFMYIGGESAYKSQQSSEYALKTKDFETEQTNKYKIIIAEINELIAKYENENQLFRRLNELFNIKKKEIKEIQNKIEEYSKIAFTSERKVIYEQHDMKRILTYNKILIFIYYGLFILYFIIGNFFVDKLYKTIIAWIYICLFIAFPFSLSWIVQKLFDIKNITSYFFNNKVYKNVYTNI